MVSANGNSIPTTPKYGDMRDYRAPSLLQPHRAREAILDAHNGRRPPLIGYFHMLANPQMCKVIAQLGFDTIMIDMEHAAMNVETMVSMVNDIQFHSEGKTHAWVRVSGHSHEDIGFAMDAGASIMIPQVTTVEQAKHILASTKFGAKRGGTRSAPPARYLPGFSDGLAYPNIALWESLNQQAAVIIQLESQEAVRNLDAILTECGDDIDACFIGMIDVRASMGLCGPWGDEPAFLETYQLFGDTLLKHNKPRAGGAMGPPEVKRMMGSANALTVVQLDVYKLLEVSMQDLTEGREIFVAKDMSTKKGEQVANGGAKKAEGEMKKGEGNGTLEAMVDAEGAGI